MLCKADDTMSLELVNFLGHKNKHINYLISDYCNQRKQGQSYLFRMTRLISKFLLVCNCISLCTLSSTAGYEIYQCSRIFKVNKIFFSYTGEIIKYSREVFHYHEKKQNLKHVGITSRMDSECVYRHSSYITMLTPGTKGE